MCGVSCVIAVDRCRWWVRHGRAQWRVPWAFHGWAKVTTRQRCRPAQTAARGSYYTRDREMIIKYLGFIVAYINKIFWHRGLLKKIRQGGTVEAKRVYGIPLQPFLHFHHFFGLNTTLNPAINPCNLLLPQPTFNPRHAGGGHGVPPRWQRSLSVQPPAAREPGGRGRGGGRRRGRGRGRGGGRGRGRGRGHGAASAVHRGDERAAEPGGGGAVGESNQGRGKGAAWPLLCLF